MKHTDLERVGELSASLRYLEAELQRIDAGTFTIFGWWAPDGTNADWHQASVMLGAEEAAIQGEARRIMKAMKERQIAAIKESLATLGVSFDEPKQLPAPALAEAA